jgi:hypothetical secreted protein
VKRRGLKLKKMIRALLVVVGLVVGGYTIMGIVRHNEMSQIVNSEEVKQIYMKRLTSIDPDALTEKGKIQKYTIDSFEKIPTGGIFVYLYVNDNKDYTVSVHLYMDYNTGKIKNGGGSWSPELDKFVKSKKAE